MTRMKIICGVCFLFPLILAGHAEDQTPQKTVHLEGYVYDSGGNPLPGVDVSVRIAGNAGSIGGGTTDMKTGHYSFDIKVQGAFDLIFRMSNRRTSVVKYLTDKHTQQISKILYRKGEKMPASALHAYIQSLDRVSFLALSLPKVKRREFLESFPEVKEGYYKFSPVKVGMREGTNEDLGEMLNREAERVQNRLNAIQTSKNR